MSRDLKTALRDAAASTSQPPTEAILRRSRVIRRQETAVRLLVPVIAVLVAAPLLVLASRDRGPAVILDSGPEGVALDEAGGIALEWMQALQDGDRAQVEARTDPAFEVGVAEVTLEPGTDLETIRRELSARPVPYFDDLSVLSVDDVRDDPAREWLEALGAERIPDTRVQLRARYGVLDIYLLDGRVRSATLDQGPEGQSGTLLTTVIGRDDAPCDLAARSPGDVWYGGGAGGPEIHGGGCTLESTIRVGAGTYEIVVTQTGVPTRMPVVTVEPGQTTTLQVDLRVPATPGQ